MKFSMAIGPELQVRWCCFLRRAGRIQFQLLLALLELLEIRHRFQTFLVRRVLSRRLRCRLVLRWAGDHKFGNVGILIPVLQLQRWVPKRAECETLGGCSWILLRHKNTRMNVRSEER